MDAQSSVVNINSTNTRFEFGANWQAFLNCLNEERIAKAEESLIDNLGLATLNGLRFLDIGSGSGLFSLVARRLGAVVYSFDYDKNSVECTKYLRQKFFSDDSKWIIEQGSVLDQKYMASLGKFDIVYSWGVLHHTGEMWKAIDYACQSVKVNGHFYIAIYNDEAGASRRWKKVKRLYNNSGKLIRSVLISYTFLKVWSITMVKDLIHHKNLLKSWSSYNVHRGMSPWYDIIDWVGGYPFEVAKPDEIFNFLKDRGFRLEKLKTCIGPGCNEYVFKKVKS